MCCLHNSHTPSRSRRPPLDMAFFGFNVRHMGSLSVSMSGSGERHTGFFYEKLPGGALANAQLHGDEPPPPSETAPPSTTPRRDARSPSQAASAGASSTSSTATTALVDPPQLPPPSSSQLQAALVAGGGLNGSRGAGPSAASTTTGSVPPPTAEASAMTTLQACIEQSGPAVVDRAFAEALSVLSRRDATHLLVAVMQQREEWTATDARTPTRGGESGATPPPPISLPSWGAGMSGGRASRRPKRTPTPLLPSPPPSSTPTSSTAGKPPKKSASKKANSAKPVAKHTPARAGMVQRLGGGGESKAPPPPDQSMLSPLLLHGMKGIFDKVAPSLSTLAAADVATALGALSSAGSAASPHRSRKCQASASASASALSAATAGGAAEHLGGKFVPGNVIRARWSCNERWYVGKIVAVCPCTDGSEQAFMVRFDDGDMERVLSHNITTHKKGESGPPRKVKPPPQAPKPTCPQKGRQVTTSPAASSPPRQVQLPSWRAASAPPSPAVGSASRPSAAGGSSSCAVADSRTAADGWSAGALVVYCRHVLTEKHRNGMIMEVRAGGGLYSVMVEGGQLLSCVSRTHLRLVKPPCQPAAEAAEAAGPVPAAAASPTPRGRRKRARGGGTPSPLAPATGSSPSKSPRRAMRAVAVPQADTQPALAQRAGGLGAASSPAAQAQAPALAPAPAPEPEPLASGLTDEQLARLLYQQELRASRPSRQRR